MKTFLLATALTGGLAVSAFADQPRLAVLQGQCTGVMIKGQQVQGPWCDSKLANMVLPNGREGFIFMLEKPGTPTLALGFFGYGSREVHTNSGQVVLPIDHIDMTVNGNSGHTPANGQCLFADPTTGRPAPVTCIATTSVGNFSGTFMSDGSMPRFSSH